MDRSEELNRLKELIHLLADAELTEYQAFLSAKDDGYKVTDTVARANAKTITNNMRKRYQLEWDYLVTKITSCKALSFQDSPEAE